MHCIRNEKDSHKASERKPIKYILFKKYGNPKALTDQKPK